MAPRVTPTLDVEQACWDAGESIVCGLDEVGRGAWAGPATMAAVVPGRTFIEGVRDSKQLSPA
ncbi:MAG: ribonuclease HII, partial [Actinomycetes bacterium]